MRLWGTCSRPLAAVAISLSVVAVLPVSGPLFAKVFESAKTALQKAFPEGTDVVRKTAFLTDGQLAEARRLAGDDAGPDSSLVSYYQGRKGKQLVGTAYFDTHKVRSGKQTLLVVVDAEGKVDSVLLVRSTESPDKTPGETWLAGLKGKKLDGDLSLSGEVDVITGATMTSRACVNATRRVLANHWVINGGGPPADPGS